MDLLKVLDLYRKDERGFELKAISFVQHKHQKIAISGETGSGKTTLMKIVGGLINPDHGEVLFENERLKRVPEEKLIPGHPGIAYLSQHFDLPHFLRVEQALEYSNELAEREAEELYSICHIGHLLKRRTDQLSGGERQRIALARLLVSKPRLLLLDEPFSNTDPAHKLVLKSIIEDLGQKLGISCIMISHDPSDTLPWADTILVMKDGYIVQQGSAYGIYHHPLNDYVAGLFGRFNIVTEALARTLSVLPEYAALRERKYLRPGLFFLSKNKGKGIEATVSKYYFMGHFYEAELLLNGISVIAFTDITPLSAGEKVFLSLKSL
jgi:ABC-type Fe3+/spermidine/putrescine transport system ATPase subunit